MKVENDLPMWFLYLLLLIAIVAAISFILR